MKKILSLLAVVLTTALGVYGQLQPAPGIFNYQGVARNSVGNVLVNQSISLRLTIHDGAPAGPVVYQESRTVTTNPFGLFNVQVGSPGAANVTGAIQPLTGGLVTPSPWATSSGLKYIQVEIDPNGGSSFINIGTAQIASVPFALYSSLSNDLVLPYNKTQADAGTLFRIVNSGSGTSGSIMGVTNTGANNAWGVQGQVNNTAAGSFSAGVLGTNLSTTGNGIGVMGTQAGSGWGVYGTAPGGIGVYGLSTTGVGAQGSSTSGTGGFFSSTSGLALNSAGNLRHTGIGEGAPLPPMTHKLLAGDAIGNGTWQHASDIGLVSGSGTLNFVPKWTPNGTTLGNSQIFDNGTAVGVGTITPIGLVHSFSNSTVPVPQFMAEENDNDYARFTFKTTNAANSGNNFWTIAGYNNDTRANERLNFWNNATGDLMSIVGNGNVGIGTTNPGTRLHVVANAPGSAVEILRNLDATGFSSSWYLSSGGGNMGHFGYGNPGAFAWTNQMFAGSIAPIPFVFTTSDIERMRITPIGNVGVGTTNPIGLVHSFSNSSVPIPQFFAEENDNDYARFTFKTTDAANSGNNFWTIAGYNNDTRANERLNFWNNATGDLMTIRGTGDVGIGTISPVAKLHVENSTTGQGGVRVYQPAELAIPGVKSLSGGVITNDASVLFPALIGTNSIFAQRGDWTSGTATLSVLNETGVLGFSPTGTGTQGVSVTGRGVFAGSTNGVGLRAFSSTGQAINSTGAIQFAGIGETNGAILTSDAVGNAQWSTLAAAGIVSGSGTLNFVPKWSPDGNTLGNSLLYDNGTFVGLGTTTPSHRLTVEHGGATGIMSRSTASFSVVDIDASSGDAALRFQRAGTGKWNTRNQPLGPSGGVDDYQIFELGGGGSRMLIQRGTGYVGIGGAGGLGTPTDAPAYQLDVLNGGGTGIRSKSSATFSVVDIDAFSGDAALRFQRAGVGQWNTRNRPLSASGSTNDYEIFELGGGGSRMVIQDATGWVGIGGAGGAGTPTDAPAYQLDVLNGGGTGIRSKSSATFSVVDIDAASGDAALRFQSSGVGKWNTRNNPGGISPNSYQIFELGGGGERMRIDAGTGKVWVGGSLDVGGTLTKGAGAFKIDHPLDPANKYLVHSFVESPDMMNIYNGNIVTDASGKAIVPLPDYFEALNMEFRYQLTVIGTFEQAIISKEVSNNQFEIATSKPGVKVSWQVTGIRHDAYAEKNRIPNTVDKESYNKGKYLSPESFNQPKEKGIFYSAPDGSNKDVQISPAKAAQPVNIVGTSLEQKPVQTVNANTKPIDNSGSIKQTEAAKPSTNKKVEQTGSVSDEMAKPVINPTPVADKKVEPAKAEKKVLPAILKGSSLDPDAKPGVQADKNVVETNRTVEHKLKQIQKKD